MNFLTVYKKIDNFIKEAYFSDSGVSTYIEDLELGQCRNWYGISWEDTYKKLKHYRYIRNRIVHDNNASEETLCSEKDVQWLERFYNDLLNGNDPLARRWCLEKQANESKNTFDGKREPLSNNDTSKESGFKKISNFFKRLFK